MVVDNYNNMVPKENNAIMINWHQDNLEVRKMLPDNRLKNLYLMAVTYELAGQ